jgi:CRP/FNR family transcriptional regulator, cyclic AMP receptor protein
VKIPRRPGSRRLRSGLVALQLAQSVHRDVRVHLLDVDPGLGDGLTGGRRLEARRRLIAEVADVPCGPCELALLTARDAPATLLVLDGLLLEEVAVLDSVSAELLSAGDLVPIGHRRPEHLLAGETRHVVLEPVRFCILDARALDAIALFPEVQRAVLERMAERVRRVAAGKAIAQVNGIDRRLLALFWQLAERWGRVTSDGVAVHMPLSHRVLAQLVGARRPSVSTALGRLVAAGELVRRADGGWLLPGEAFGEPVGDGARTVRPRRRFTREGTTTVSALARASGTSALH